MIFKRGDVLSWSNGDPEQATLIEIRGRTKSKDKYRLSSRLNLNYEHDLNALEDDGRVFLHTRLTRLLFARTGKNFRCS